MTDPRIEDEDRDANPRMKTVKMMKMMQMTKMTEMEIIKLMGLS